jgi:hypothetical protein
MPWPTRDFLFHNFHPPDEVRVYTTPHRSIKHWDGSALVMDLCIGDAILRKYAFADRWFEVNCTFDHEGRLLTEPGVLDWAFNCDMCTPIVVDGQDVYNVDLSLDVFVGPDGVTHEVTDEDDFAQAVASGWLTATEAQGARRGLEDLLAVIGGDGLLAFLQGILPFDGVTRCAPQDAPARRPIGEFPRFALGEREKVWTPAAIHGRP